MSVSTVKRLLVILGIILFFAFIGFSYLVAKEVFNQLDFDLTVKFQDRIPRRLDYIFSWFSVLGSAEVTMTIWFIALILMVLKRFWLAAVSLFSLPLALAMEVYGKLFVHHPAPPFMFYRGGLVDVNFPIHFTHTNFSYPSGHETRTAYLIIFIMLYLYFRHGTRLQLILQPILVGILVVMTISRIYLGEHWTSDVAGGFLAGAAFGILTGAAIPAKKKPKKITEEPAA